MGQKPILDGCDNEKPIQGLRVYSLLGVPNVPYHIGELKLFLKWTK